MFDVTNTVLFSFIFLFDRVPVCVPGGQEAHGHPPS